MALEELISWDIALKTLWTSSLQPGMAKLKETTLLAKCCSVLRLTLEDDKMLSRKVTNLVLSRVIRNTWRISINQSTLFKHGK